MGGHRLDSIQPGGPVAWRGTPGVFGRLGALGLVAAAAACGPADRPGAGDDDDPGPGPGNPDAAAPRADAGGFIDAQPLPDGDVNAVEAVIYSHTSTTLFRVNADTLALSTVGDFTWPAGIMNEAITDIAVDETGDLIGVSLTRLYRINPLTAQATLLADLEPGRQFNALSWVPAGVIPGASGETLVGAAGDGSLWRVSLQTGQAMQIGSFGSGYTSSGDLVSIEGAGTFAAIKDGGKDKLARVDPTTGAATPVGTGIGFPNVYGLGYWKGRLYGFTSWEQIIVIDPTTGKGTLQQMTPGRYWYGAGVTTKAPIIE
jgi:hypothetical protein